MRSFKNNLWPASTSVVAGFAPRLLVEWRRSKPYFHDDKQIPLLDIETSVPRKYFIVSCLLFLRLLRFLFNCRIPVWSFPVSIYTLKMMFPLSCFLTNPCILHILSLIPFWQYGSTHLYETRVCFNGKRKCHTQLGRSQSEILFHRLLTLVHILCVRKKTKQYIEFSRDKGVERFQKWIYFFWKRF